MQVRADITADDYRAFLRHASRRHSSRRRLPFWLLVAGWLAVVVVFTWLYTATSLKPGYILSCGVGILVGMAAFYVVSRTLRRLAPDDDAHLGTRTIIVDEEGARVCVCAETFETRIPLDAVIAVEQAPEHVFVHADRAAPIIVPKRSFASAEEIDQFVTAVRKRG